MLLQMCSWVPECFPTVSMVGGDEIMSMLGHTLQWLLDISDSKGGTEKSMGGKYIESFSIAS